MVPISMPSLDGIKSGMTGLSSGVTGLLDKIQSPAGKEKLEEDDADLMPTRNVDLEDMEKVPFLPNQPTYNPKTYL